MNSHINNRISNRINNRYNYNLSFGEGIWSLLLALFLGQVFGVILTIGLNYLGLEGLGIMASFGVSFGVTILVLFYYKKLSFTVWKQMVFNNQKIIYWILSILLYISILPLTEYVTTLVPTEGIQILEDLYKVVVQSFEIIFKHPIAAFITICILAPILEETIFRGFLLQGFLNNKINPWIAILITSFLFGFAHLNPWQFIGAGILGACFGFIYWRTGSLLICIFLHFLNNTISYLITMQAKDLDVTFFEMNYYLIIGSIILTSLLIYLFHKKTIHADIRNSK